MKRSGFVLIVFLTVHLYNGYPQVLTHIDSMYEAVCKMPDSPTKVSYLTDVSGKYHAMHNSREIDAAEYALVLAKKLNNDTCMMEAYYQRGLVTRKTGILYFDSCYAMAKEKKDKKHMAACLASYAWVEKFERKNIPKAIEYYIESARLSEEIGKHEYTLYRYQELAAVFMGMRERQKVYYYLQKCLDLAIMINDADALTNVYGALSGYYYHKYKETDTVDYTKAHLYNDLSLKYAKQSGLRFYELKAAIGRGEIYQKEKKYSLALEAKEEVKKIAAEIHDTLQIYRAELTSVQTYLFLNLPARAKAAIDIAALVAEKVNYKETVEMDGALYSYFEYVKNFEKALYYYKRVQARQDSTWTVEKTNRMNELEAVYESEKKDKEIKLLAKDKSLQQAYVKQQQFFIYASVSFAVLLMVLLVIAYRSFRLRRRSAKVLFEVEKHHAVENVRNRISRDMHDEIGSSLTKISLLSETLKTKMNETEAEGIVSKITASSRGVISNMSEIIWATNPEHDNLASMISYFRDYTSRFFEDTPVKCTIDFPEDVPEISIAPELRRNLFLVLKESLNNILKHAFASTAFVEIKLKGNQMVLSIKDNGAGFDTSDSKKFSNGLKNMKRRMEETGSIFEINSAPGKGTTTTSMANIY